MSYGDAVVVATAVADRELPPSPDEVDLGEGLIGRAVQLRVDRVLWARTGAPPAPASITLDVPGWVFDGDERTEMAVEGFDRVTVGASYLIPIVRYPDTGWGALSSVTRLDDADDAVRRDVAGPAELPMADGPPRDAALTSMAGHSVDDVAGALAATPPDPLAVEHFDLDPIARWNAVGAELDARDSSTTRPPP